MQPPMMYRTSASGKTPAASRTARTVSVVTAGRPTSVCDHVQTAAATTSPTRTNDLTAAPWTVMALVLTSGSYRASWKTDSRKAGLPVRNVVVLMNVLLPAGGMSARAAPGVQRMRYRLFQYFVSGGGSFARPGSRTPA